MDVDGRDAETMAEDHEEWSDWHHDVQIKTESRNADGKVLVYCLDCDWEAWGLP